MLIRRLVARDEAALAALYDRYAGVVYSVACRILRDTGAAEEVLQDIFYQLWQRPEKFDAARGSLSGWLLVSARNRSIDRLRRRDPKLAADPAAGDVMSPLDLEGAAAQQELMSKALAAFADLPAPQREAMELAYFEGLTHTEIAQRTGEPLGTVKTRLRTALESVKRAVSL